LNMDKVALLRKKAASLPLEPGVYIMKNAKNEIIYIGKAKLLRNRVSSYFRSVEKHLVKVYRMVEHVEDFDYIVCDSEFEALVLECSLIKLHTPKYNILLKDDKGYHYIRISGGDFPRITAEKQQSDPSSVYLGPYTSSVVVRETVEEANKAFLLPVCSRRFPEDFGKHRPCLNYHIKQCMGVCSGKISKSAYMEAFNGALDFIKGGSAATVAFLTEKMLEASEALDFEKAARFRDRINAINKITEKQKVIEYNHKSLDVIAAVCGEDTVFISLLILRNGRLRDKQDFSFDFFESTDNVLSEFILSYYSSCEDMPSEIFLPFSLTDEDIISRLLSEKSRKKVTLTVPLKGQSLKLVEMAQNNAAQAVAIRSGRTGREMAALDELGRLLALPAPPAYIEAYDISNFGSQTIVGGMVVIENGRPNKKLYKHFTISGQDAPDDYAAMYQMLSRRFARLVGADKSPCGKAASDGFERTPDLLLIDGGSGHVQTAQRVLENFGLSIPVFGMVKDSRHRTRAISAGDREIAINASRSVFSLVTSIQDEVHRFSIDYSRKKHKTSSFILRLTEAEGIGRERAKQLYRRFKTFKAISEATVEELAQVQGMNLPAAKSLYRFLHPSPDEPPSSPAESS